MRQYDKALAERRRVWVRHMLSMQGGVVRQYGRVGTAKNKALHIPRSWVR